MAAWPRWAGDVTWEMSAEETTAAIAAARASLRAAIAAAEGSMSAGDESSSSEGDESVTKPERDPKPRTLSREGKQEAARPAVQRPIRLTLPRQLTGEEQRVLDPVPTCVAVGCHGIGHAIAERAHMLRCDTCHSMWQSSWWYAFLSKGGYTYAPPRFLHREVIRQNTRSGWLGVIRRARETLSFLHDTRRRRKADFARRYETDIETHPGPSPSAAPPTHPLAAPPPTVNAPPPRQSLSTRPVLPNRGRKRLPCLTNNPAMCPDGHTETDIIGSAPTVLDSRRQNFECQHADCSRARFTQIRPGALAEGESREATWTKGRSPESMRTNPPTPRAARTPSVYAVTPQQSPAATTPIVYAASTPIPIHAATGASEGTPATAQVPGPSRKKHEPCLGDDAFAYCNIHGMSEPAGWNAYVHNHVLPTTSMQGFLETMWDENMAEALTIEMSNSGVGRLYTACTSPLCSPIGQGCALLIRKDIALTKRERVVYRHRNGKGLGVHLEWHGQKILVLLLHAPANGDDGEQAEFYQEVKRDLQREYSTLREEWPEDYSATGDMPSDRRVIWAADHNHVADLRRDCMPPYTRKAMPGGVRRRQELSRYLGNTVDAYRHLHPEGRATSRTTPAKPAKYGRDGTLKSAATDEHSVRIDAVEVAPELMRGSKGFVRAQHIDPSNYIVKYKRRRQGDTVEKVSDHWTIRLTFRISNIPRPKREPSFASEMVHTLKGVQALKTAMREALAEKDVPSTEIQERLVKAWMDISAQYRK